MNKTSNPHSIVNADLFSVYQTSETGLTEGEAQKRQLEFGLNQLPMAPPTPWWKRLFSQFHNVLIYVLLASAVLSAIMQHYVDSGVIFAVVIVNAIVGFIQEGKAESALRAIMSMAKTNCMAIRDGVLESTDSAELVPGDVVMLQAGDRVPADVRLFYVKELRCDESALTGESQPVGKHADCLADKTPLAERKNMAFMGTMVTFGVARGVVVKTGHQTEIGAISDMVGRVTLPQTPLQLQLKTFAHQLTAGIIVVSAVTMLLGIWLHDFAIKQMFQAAIGIAVSSIPEGLPAIVTIALAIGVQRMAKSHALIRRLPAVEVLDSVDVICSDKTGTLTANAMTVRQLFCSNGHYQVSGEGYTPEGLIQHLQSQAKVLMGQDASLTQATEVALLCNDAYLSQEGNQQWVLHGDPTEGALLTLAFKHGLSKQLTENEWPRVDLLPFESEKRYMATLHHNSEGLTRLMVKGAPDRLLGFAQSESYQGKPVALVADKWQQAMADYAAQGMRVLALAYKDFEHRPETLSHQDVESGLTLLALVGISDPPRKEAISSIAQCHQAGIRVKMITGDNPITAAAIGKELGLNTERVITGAEIDAMSQQQLADVTETVDIYARTSPANKLSLVEAMQAKRHVVAMTGDGVNDAPALKKASIGVAMGHKGTDAAKEAADFVLTDDNFSTIARAVAEGRTVYDNIVKSIVFVLPTNLAEALVIFSAIMMGRMMPITPAQILWINMITAIILALALAFERSEYGIMQRPPRPYNQGLFTKELLLRMLLVGGYGALAVFSLFYFYRANGASIELSRTVAVNALVMVELLYLFNCRFLHQTIFSRFFFVGSMPVLSAVMAVILIQLIFTYQSDMQRIFELEPLVIADWLALIAAAVPVLFLVELHKYVHKWMTKSPAKSNPLV